MTNSTTGDKPNSSYRYAHPKGPNWSTLIAAALLIHVIGIGSLGYFGFFYTSLEINKEEARIMAKEAERRARERRERERLEKQERMLRQEDRKDLVQHEQEVPRQQLIDHVKELQRIDSEMFELKSGSLNALELRDDEQYRNYLAQEIRRLTHELYDDLFNSRNPNYGRFARTALRFSLRSPLLELRLSADTLADDIDNETHLGQMVERAETNERNMQRLRDAAPGTERAAEEAAVAKGREIRHLARELAGLQPLNPENYRDTKPGRQEQNPDLRPGNLPGLTPEELLKLASGLEKQINQNFDHLRAARMAQLMNLPLFQAMENLIAGALPQREMPDFPMNPDTFAALKALQDALQEALNQAAQMASRAGQQLSSAKGIPAPPGMTPPIPGSMPGMGVGMGFNPGGMGMGPGQLNLRQNLDLTPPRNPSVAGAEERDNQGNQREGGDKMISGVRLPDLDLRSRENLIHANSLPGHRFSRNSQRSGWVYLNTFYTIGPWENNGEIDWSRQHGPDPTPFMNIDLDAVYTDGKRKARVPVADSFGTPGILTTELDGELCWRFVQTDAIRMTFPDEVENGTYYAYTEVYFEESMDMDVLIASDDATTAWISNAHPAYNPSGANCFKFHTEGALSEWDLGESRKRLRFTRGLNRILIRLENGPQFARLSVLLSPVGAISD